MDELKRLNNNQYAYLRQLPIDKLLELLDIAPVPTSCPEDEAYVDALEEAIIEKENENPTGFFPDVDQQWNEFVTYYMPSASETEAEPKNLEHTASPQIPQPSTNAPSKRVIRFNQVRRTVLVAAAAIACMLAIMVTAQATGVDVFGAMARWTEDIFSFGRIPPDSVVSENLSGEMGENEASAQEQKFSSLQKALDAYGIAEVHEPAWLPEGYALGTLDVTYWDDPFHIALYATYVDGEDGIGIDIISYESEPSMQVQKTDAPVEIMEKNDISFYLIKNASSYTVAWYDDQYEYYISGNLSKDILWETAISMYD